MFQSKSSKKQSKQVVDSLLSDYLNVTPKSHTAKSGASKKSQASKIEKISKDSNVASVERIQFQRKKSKQRKSLNKKLLANEAKSQLLIKQSRLANGDAEIVQEVLNDRLDKLKQLDSLNDAELIGLQNEIASLRNKVSQDDVHEAVLSNRERNERRLQKVLHKDDATVGLTPGLAMPGQSDDEDESEEDDDEDAEDALDNFKDDFDDYN